MSIYTAESRLGRLATYNTEQALSQLKRPLFSVSATKTGGAGR